MTSSKSGSKVLTVEILGISDISKAEIEAHFQKEKYGGGKATVISLEEDKAIMTIVAERGITSECKDYESKSV